MEFLQEHIPWEPNWPLNAVFDMAVRAGSKEYKASIYKFNAWRGSRFGMQAGGFKWADNLSREPDAFMRLMVALYRVLASITERTMPDLRGLAMKKGYFYDVSISLRRLF